MSVAQTSLWAYQDKIKSGSLSTSRRAVFEVIEELGPICDRDICDRLGWTINRVTNRRGELFDLMKIEKAYIAPYPSTGRKVTYWQVRND